MKALLLKDFYLIKRSLKGILLMVLMFLVLGWHDKNGQMLFAIIPVTTLSFISLFSYDQMSHFENFAMTFPIKKTTYVLEKYICGTFMAIGSSLITLFICLIKSTVGSLSLSFAVQGIALSFMCSIIIFSISLPLFFKFTVENARIYFIVAMLFFTFGGTFLANQIGIPAISFVTLLIALSITALLLIFISYFISFHFFSKKFN